MPIRTIPLSRLETELRKTLDECADSGETVVVELPDRRLLMIQALDPSEDDDLIDELIESNAEFQAGRQIQGERSEAVSRHGRNDVTLIGSRDDGQIVSCDWLTKGILR